VQIHRDMHIKFYDYSDGSNFKGEDIVFQWFGLMQSMNTFSKNAATGFVTLVLLNCSLSPRASLLILRLSVHI
jgi:hypothetical protein